MPSVPPADPPRPSSVADGFAPHRGGTGVSFGGGRRARGVAGAARRFASTLVDLALPARCLLCDGAGAPLCDACRHDAMVPLDDGCVACALPLPRGRPDRRCGRCLRKPPAYDRTFAAAAYAAPFDRLVLGLKYGAALSYAPLFAALVDRRVRTRPRPVTAQPTGAREPAVDEAAGDRTIDAIDAVIAVPLSRERMAARGFNQSIEVARALARRWGRRLDTTSLLRIHDTVPQAGLSFDERRGNVRRAFAVTDDGRARLAGRTVAVVDDVMTTGATLDEVARTLKRAGVAVVVNAVVARRP